MSSLGTHRGNSPKRRGIASKVFWNNPHIPRLSRILFLAMLALIPIGYFVGAYYVDAQDCLARSQRAYALLFGILALDSIYIWVVDRPLVLQALREAIAKGEVTIRKIGRSYEIDQGDPSTRSLSVGRLVFTTVVCLMFLPVCFWDPFVMKMCSGQLRGSPPIALVVLGTTFCTVVAQQVLSWMYATMAVWRVSE